MSMTIYDKVLEKLKKNKEVELYRFVFVRSGDLEFYTEKTYTAEDGDKIKRTVVLTSIFGLKYRLEKINIIGTALIRGEPFLLKSYQNDYGLDSILHLSPDYISQYSFSIKEAMERQRIDIHSYFLGKDGSLYEFEKDEESKGKIELLLSKGLISKIEDYNRLR